jgi:hypothetical protein
MDGAENGIIVDPGGFYIKAASEHHPQIPVPSGSDASRTIMILAMLWIALTRIRQSRRGRYVEEKRSYFS